MNNSRTLQALRRFWEEISQGRPAVPGDLDPELAALIERLHATPDVPPPDQTYARHLREHLMHTTSVALSPTIDLPANGREPSLPTRGLLPPVTRPSRQRHTWPLAQAAIVLLILTAMVVAYLVVLRPQREPTFAPAVGTPVPASNSDDWPMYRSDPERSGVTSREGPEGQPLTLWTYQADGSAARSPAIADSVVYLQTGDGMVTALDAPTGAVLWQNPDTGTVENTPAVADSTLSLITLQGELVALDTVTGAERWRFGNALAPECMPVVLDGTVYMGSDDGNVYAIDAASGEVRWQRTISGPVWRSLAIGGGMIFAGTSNGRLEALDLATGDPRWQFDGGDETQTVGTPTYADNTVFLNHAGTMYALDAASGAEQWRKSFPGARPAAITGGLAISTSADGTVYALDTATGADRWAFDTGEDLNAAPVVADGVAYVATLEGTLLALDVTTGAERWRLPLDGGVVYGPSIADGTLFTGTDAGTLYAIGGDGTQHLSAPLAVDTATPDAAVENGIAAGEGPAIDAVSFLGTIADPGHPFDAPGGLAEAADGTLYVVDINHNQVQRFDRDGRAIGPWGGPDDPDHEFVFGNAEAGYGDIRIGADGAIYILEHVGARVQKLAPDGTVLASWGEQGTGEGQFLWPTTLLIAPHGDILVVDSGNHRIQVFDQEGTLLRIWGKAGSAPGSLVRPWSVIVRPNGTYLVSDVGHQVFAYDQDGNYLGTARAGDGPSSDKETAEELDIDAAGNIYIGDYRNNRMTVLAPDLTTLAAWGKEGSGDGEFQGLSGFALGQQGRVLISDEGGNRVEVFQFAPPSTRAASSATPTP